MTLSQTALALITPSAFKGWQPRPQRAPARRLTVSSESRLQMPPVTNFKEMSEAAQPRRRQSVQSSLEVVCFHQEVEGRVHGPGEIGTKAFRRMTADYVHMHRDPREKKVDQEG